MQIAKFAPPPIPPPIYEKQKPVFEYGVKGPLVVFTGIFNVFLLFLFYRSADWISKLRPNSHESAIAKIDGKTRWTVFRGAK